MNKITNDRDFRIGYEILHWATERVAEAGGDTEGRRERVIELKRNLRQYAHRDTHTVDVGMGFLCKRRIISDDYDGYIELVSIPEVFDTLDDDADGNPGARTFFKEFLEIHARPSMYDCTGQAFTCWYKLFKRRGQFWVYHSVGLDV